MHPTARGGVLVKWKLPSGGWESFRYTRAGFRRVLEGSTWLTLRWDTGIYAATAAGWKALGYDIPTGRARAVTLAGMPFSFESKSAADLAALPGVK